MEQDRQVALIQENLSQIRERLGAAAARAGRRAEEIEIAAVTKGQTARIVRAAYDAGLRLFAESYAQEAAVKEASLAGFDDIRWHFIGHLQTNKARPVAGRFALIQSLDSERLARRLDEIADQGGFWQDVLVQVHLGDETSKFGVRPEETLALCQSIAALPRLRLKGLMGIAPLGEDPRPYFAALRTLYMRLPASERRILSMGQSADFETAVEEGATMVRIGTVLVGGRQAR